MKILVTGVCGFVGSSLVHAILEADPFVKVYGLDNFIRPGSESNRAKLKKLGVKLYHADIRSASDLETLPEVDWLIDAAANPSVLAGVDGQTSSRQLVEHNLVGTINLLEFCKRVKAGFVLLSTSRVYAIPGLANIQVEVSDGAYRPVANQNFPAGLSEAGVAESYSTQAPVSLYGSTKIASEILALEYGHTFGFPVWIDRCGVLAGAGQFGRPDQGIFAYWINSWFKRRPLKYIGFDGEGHQVRDLLHPKDLAQLVLMQMREGRSETKPAVVNVSGGPRQAMSLLNLSLWCESRFGPHEVATEGEPRLFDIPWMILDNRLAQTTWGWSPATSASQILDEIAAHAEANPDWLEISAPL